MGYEVALLLVNQPASHKTTHLEKWNTLAATGQILPKFETYALVTKLNFTNASNEDNLPWKMTS